MSGTISGHDHMIGRSISTVVQAVPITPKVCEFDPTHCEVYLYG